MTLTESLQIDAILTDSPDKLVHFFCAGAWASLPQLWTVTPAQVYAEAQRRGWECLVASRLPGDNFVVVEEGNEYVSCYAERGGIQAKSARTFPALEPAARDMLSRRMQSLGLPSDEVRSNTSLERTREG